MQLREVLPTKDGRHLGKVIAGNIKKFQIFEICQFVRQGHKTVGADSQPLELGQLADMLTRVKVLEEGIGIAKEGKFLSSSKILHLERQALLGVEKVELG